VRESRLTEVHLIIDAPREEPEAFCWNYFVDFTEEAFGEAVLSLVYALDVSTRGQERSGEGAAFVDESSVAEESFHCSIP
jgi:hypothetical protein